MLLAVMDLGSNSFKMTVAQWAPELSRTRPFRILHKERHPIQLGASVFSQGKISSKDFKEGVRAIKKMQERLRDFASPILRVVATSAIRDSSNGREFVRYVNEELALPIEVISGAEEASLISRGLQWEFPKVSRGLLIDIGGGSTEVASFGTSAQDLYCQSYRIGSVRVAMKFFKKKVSKDSLPRIRSQIRATLKDPPKFKFEKVVGSAGTIQSLGQIFGLGIGLKSIKLIELDRWILANLNASPQSIVKRFKVQPSRARVLVAGALVLSEVLHWLGQSELNVTGMTLRDGVLVDLVSHWKDELVTDDHHLSESSFSRIQTLGISKELLSFLEATAQKYHVDL
jgi:exopolyphosphatase / guanosine-5'-triphosphate,3'-diphosphate pyrophosphatase